MRHPHDLIRIPIITEKATDAKEHLNKVTLSVDPRAGKQEVKRAVEEVFKVSVENVNIMNVKGKKKRLGKYAGKRADWKKAIVTLKEGNNIEVMDQV